MRGEQDDDVRHLQEPWVLAHAPDKVLVRNL